MGNVRRKPIAFYQRREFDLLEMKSNYKVNFSGENKKTYIAKCNKKIKNVRWQISRIKKRYSVIKNIYSLVVEYFNEDPKLKFGIQRNVFFKYCMEHGVNGRDARDFLGIKGAHTPSRCRQRIIKDESSKITYHKFLSFVEYVSGNQVYLKKVH